jgi:hypothetical protein
MGLRGPMKKKQEEKKNFQWAKRALLETTKNVSW